MKTEPFFVDRLGQPSKRENVTPTRSAARALTARDRRFYLHILPCRMVSNICWCVRAYMLALHAQSQTSSSFAAFGTHRLSKQTRGVQSWNLVAAFFANFLPLTVKIWFRRFLLFALQPRILRLQWWACAQVRIRKLAARCKPSRTSALHCRWSPFLI